MFLPYWPKSDKVSQYRALHSEELQTDTSFKIVELSPCFRGGGGGDKRYGYVFHPAIISARRGQINRITNFANRFTCFIHYLALPIRKENDKDCCDSPVVRNRKVKDNFSAADIGSRKLVRCFEINFTSQKIKIEKHKLYLEGASKSPQTTQKESTYVHFYIVPSPQSLYILGTLI